MNLRLFLLFFLVAAWSGPFALSAADKPSDATIKKQLIGYWQSPRHPYEIHANGIIYMCPRSICTTSSPWDVRNGIFYWGQDANEIVTLTPTRFAFRSVKPPRTLYELERISKKDAE